MDVIQNVKVCAKTDLGYKYETNEDRFLILDGETEFIDINLYGRLYALADGMGGHSGGEVASKMACEGIIDYYSKITHNKNNTDRFSDRLNLLKSTIYDVHNKIFEYGRITNEYEDMGTTLSVMVLIKNKALIAHVGDSRIYRLRENELVQLTEDHTIAQLLVQIGHLTPQAASKHPIRHVLTKALGQGIEDIFLKIEQVERGDIFLMCSDGLHDLLTDMQIKDVLLKNYSVNDKCCRLVAQALQMGGKDNVTVIVIEV